MTVWEKNYDNWAESYVLLRASLDGKFSVEFDGKFVSDVELFKPELFEVEFVVFVEFVPFDVLFFVLFVLFVELEELLNIS